MNDQPAKAAQFPPKLYTFTIIAKQKEELAVFIEGQAKFIPAGATEYYPAQEVEAMLAAERDKVKERLDALEVAMINYRRGLLTILSNCPDRKTYSKYRWIAEEWLQTGDRSKAVAEGSK